MFTLHGFEFHRLTQIPKRETGPDGGVSRQDLSTPVTAALAAALTGSHADLLATGQPLPSLLTAWIRDPGDGRLHFLLGGRPRFPPAIPNTPEKPAGPRPVLFPPGAVALDLPAAAAVGLLEQFPFWVACASRPDALWGPSDRQREPTLIPRGAFDRYATHLRGPFAWLVLAEPLSPQELKPELDRLVNEILPLSRGEVGEAKRIALERKQLRHRELSRAQVGGAWRVRVLVGALTGDAAGMTASMLCAASELQDLPYVLAPHGHPGPLAVAAQERAEDPFGNRTLFTAGTELMVALTRPPDRELPGLRLAEPHTFDVTPEARAGGGLSLGDVLDEAGVATGGLLLGRSTMNRHTFVCGATGGGKSQTVRHLLTEASRVGLPWLVVEPAKAEYRRMAGRLAPLGQNVVVIRPGDPERAPAGFNPLEPAGRGPEPARRFPLQTHVDLLRALFMAAFESHEPFPQILAISLTRCYEELGWDLTLGEPARPGPRPRYPTLGDLQRVAASVVSEIGYGAEVAADVHGFIQVRLSSLRLGTTGRMFEGGHPLDFDRLLGRNVVFEIQDVGDDADKAFLMGAVLLRLSEHLRINAEDQQEVGLSHLTVIEEAHRLLRKAENESGGATAHAVEMFASLLAEVRAYGEGLIIAEQIPSKLTPDVIKNTAAKIVHRLPAKDDRDSVGATMNLDDPQSRYVVTLEPGYAAVFTDGMDSPLLVHVPNGLGPEKAAVEPEPVADLIGRRSVTCGAACLADACTLRQMRSAQHLLTRHPWLTLWAELTVLAHLIGRPAPAAAGDRLRAVARDAGSAQVLDCAISHAVDDAVAVRTSALRPDARPEDLARHGGAVLSAHFDGGSAGVVCADDKLGFLADIHKWLLPAWELSDGDPDDGPHPDTAEWAIRYGRSIPGETRLQQRIAVNVLWNMARSDQAKRDAVDFGTRSPSAIETAVGAGRADRNWKIRLAAALEPFGDCRWPATHLIPDDDEGGDQ